MEPASKSRNKIVAANVKSGSASKKTPRKAKVERSPSPEQPVKKTKSLSKSGDKDLTQNMDDAEIEVPIKQPKKLKKKDMVDEEAEPKSKKSTNKVAAKKELEDDEDAASDYMNKFNIDNIIEPVRPSKPMTSYMFFANQMRTDRDPSVKFDVSEQSKKAAEQWKQLSDKEKEPFVKLNEADKKRFEEETRQFESRGYFVNKDGVSSLDLALKNPKFKPDVMLPKKVQSSYQCFMKTNYDSIKADVVRENPDAKMTQISQKIGQLWAALSEEQKEPYSAQQEKDRERYDAQVQELLTKGYFVNEQGVKSTDLKKKVKRVKKVEKTEATDEDESDAADEADEKPKKKVGKKVGVKRARPDSAGSDSPDKVVAEPKKKRARKE